MHIDYLFLDVSIQAKTKRLCQNKIEKYLKDNDVNCRCRHSQVTVNGTDRLDNNFAAVIKCGCGRLRVEPYLFAIGTK